jgi:SAM-dependent MidA family methyltransferase
MSELRRIIEGEILAKGPISAARFMDLALYCPVYGFYEKEADTIGRKGHFFTSTSVGPLFGELLAGEFLRWMDAIDAGALLLLEAGAHNGRLALDILNWIAAENPDVYQSCAYIILESSSRRRAWQQTTLSQHSRNVSWIEGFSLLKGHASQAAQPLVVIFSNELLDAFPVHRLQWRAAKQQWVEWGVGSLPDGSFEWTELPGVTPEAEPFLPSAPLTASLPDGYFIEVSPAAARWWNAAAAALPPGGCLFTFDYGLTAEDRLVPERTSGTLRAYRAHQVTDEVLEDPGSRDITAHVDFSLLQKIGGDAGLTTQAFLPQGRYLAQIAASRLAAGCAWDPARIRQFKTLTHPTHLGQSFKVLIQRKPK